METQMVKKEILHFLHDQPLSLIQVEECMDKRKLICSGCRKGLSNPSYGCSTKDFYLHESCSQIPQNLEVYFHPCSLSLSIAPRFSCNACFRFHPGPGFIFRCGKCCWVLDLDCALKPTTLESKVDNRIEHFTHRHPLQLVHPNEERKKFFCSICRKLCIDAVYGCRICKPGFFIHRSCMGIPQQIDKHPFHPDHSLILLTKLSYKCEGCDERYSKCLAYKCGKCDANLDVECALLPTADCKTAKRVQHIYHQHPLDKIHDSTIEISPQCLACGECSPAPEFGCLRCNFYLHRSCAIDPFQQAIFNHPFHPNHRLKIIYDKGLLSECKACCRQDCNRLWYSCLDCSNFKMHLNCSKLAPSINCCNHRHLFTLFKNMGNPGPCLFCDKECTSFFLRCVDCNINLHIQCHPSAPETVKHEYHRCYDLILTPSPLDYDLEEYGKFPEYYCDFCELPRPASDPVYRCTNCIISADIRCIISRVLPLLKEEDHDGDYGNPEHEESVQLIEERTQVLKSMESTRLKLKAQVHEMKQQIKDLRAQIKAREWELKVQSMECERVKPGIRELEILRMRCCSKTKPLMINKESDN